MGPNIAELEMLLGIRSRREGRDEYGGAEYC